MNRRTDIARSVHLMQHMYQPSAKIIRYGCRPEVQPVRKNPVEQNAECHPSEHDHTQILKILLAGHHGIQPRRRKQQKPGAVWDHKEFVKRYPVIQCTGNGVLRLQYPFRKKKGCQIKNHIPDSITIFMLFDPRYHMKFLSCHHRRKPTIDSIQDIHELLQVLSVQKPKPASVRLSVSAAPPPPAAGFPAVC